MTNYPVLTALLHPRYWLTWLGIGVLWLVVQLPYPVIYRLGCGFRKTGVTFYETTRKNCASQPGTVLPGNERTRTP
ncbi:LpxL/LpxP family acyltransferase [Escherichia coli]